VAKPKLLAAALEREREPCEDVDRGGGRTGAAEFSFVEASKPL